MTICRLCGKQATITFAYYDGAFVCEKCYKILDDPKINHPERLSLRIKMHEEYEQKREMNKLSNGGYY